MTDIGTFAGAGLVVGVVAVTILPIILEALAVGVESIEDALREDRP